MISATFNMLAHTECRKMALVLKCQKLVAVLFHNTDSIISLPEEHFLFPYGFYCSMNKDVRGTFCTVLQETSQSLSFVHY